MHSYLTPASSRACRIMSMGTARTHRRVITACAAEAQAHQLASRSVAVIGGGAAGMAAARELLREGHRVTVFEMGPTLGGTWVYDQRTDSDPEGRQPNRTRVHSSMYRNLRTNLPREVMSFSDFPFQPQAMGLVAAGARYAHAAPHTRISPDPGQGSDHTPSNQPPTAVGPCDSIDPRRFPSHEEVLRYLHAYATFYELTPHVQFTTQVLSATPVPAQPLQAADQPQHDSSGTQGLPIQSQPTQGPPVRWVIRTQQQSDHHGQANGSGPAHGAMPMPGSAQPQTWEFDALVVANGHYTEPSLPSIPGMESCPVRQMHSHNYREPEPFRDMVVLVVGASNSGEDISRELSGVASRVLLSARTWKEGELGPEVAPYGDGNNIYRYPLVERLTPDGQAVFPGGLQVRIDAVIYATGYLYSFPFLAAGDQAQGLQGVPVEVHCEGRYVSPLYLHVFPASPLAPWISFIGLPWRTIPFPQSELQARLVARALSGRAALPPPEAMAAHVSAHFRTLQEQGLDLRYAHMQHHQQFPYNAELVALAGAAPLPEWRERMYKASGEIKRTSPGVYRDAEWSGMDDILQQMQADVQAQLERMRSSSQDLQLKL